MPFDKKVAEERHVFKTRVLVNNLTGFNETRGRRSCLSYMDVPSCRTSRGMASLLVNVNYTCKPSPTKLNDVPAKPNKYFLFS